jgi:hypothetical protein
MDELAERGLLCDPKLGRTTLPRLYDDLYVPQGDQETHEALDRISRSLRRDLFFT